MIQKRAIAFLGMALLVAFSGFAARAYAGDQQDCTSDGGWFDQDVNVCEYEAP
jgi:hypothetical protein